MLKQSKSHYSYLGINSYPKIDFVFNAISVTVASPVPINY